MKHIVDYMIGDWIIVEGKPVQIAAIHQKKVGYHKWEGRLSWIRLDQVQHIPLTHDLLIKNGFEKISDSGYRWKVVAGDGSFWITLEDRLDGIWDMMVRGYSNFSDDTLQKEMTGRFLMVHHVQHEFVEEGIKKEFIM